MELLARTEPAIYDVLMAFLEGGVEIVASSKKYVMAIVGLIADYRQCLTRLAVK